MKEERKLVESTSSIEHYEHYFILCDESERENVLLVIKSQYPGLDIEVTRTGYKIKVIRKKTDKEKESFFKANKPKDTSYQELFTQDNKGKRGKK